ISCYSKAFIQIARRLMAFAFTECSRLICSPANNFKALVVVAIFLMSLTLPKGQLVVTHRKQLQIRNAFAKRDSPVGCEVARLREKRYPGLTHQSFDRIFV